MKIARLFALKFTNTANENSLEGAYYIMSQHILSNDV